MSTVRFPGIPAVADGSEAVAAARAGLEGEDLMREVRVRLLRFFGKRGERVVEANLALIREAYAGVIDVRHGSAPERATREQREVVT